MSKVFRFDNNSSTFVAGSSTRKLITESGCNEPFKNRFYCPRRKFVMLEKCPFKNREECDNFILMCGKL